jgi:uncharacterized protein YkwD
MRWSWRAAIPLGAALILAAIPASTAFASSNQSGEVAATAPAPSQPAGPMASVDTLEEQLLSMINAQRADAGVGPVQPVEWAHSVAVQHSQDMAAAGDIWHNIAGFIDQGRSAMGATYLGENVAMDSTLAADDALLFSDIPHRNITLDGRYNSIGVGIALDSKNWVYVTEDFAQIPGGSARPTVASTKPATPRAAPVVKAPVAAATTKAAATTTRAVVAPPVPHAPEFAPPVFAPPVVAAPAPLPAHAVAAKPVSHTSPIKGGVWVLVGLVGLLIAAFSGRHFVAVLGQRSRRRRTVVPPYSFGNTTRSTRTVWRRAA